MVKRRQTNVKGGHTPFERAVNQSFLRTRPLSHAEIVQVTRRPKLLLAVKEPLFARTDSGALSRLKKKGQQEEQTCT
ncbi:hypothetical protein FRC12_004255 [Ceratobasidium sp. 428]|nr:hypothetical protein FRC12_004255 [Ceratobasidium sp. 428]